MLERCRRDSFQGTSFFASLQNIHRALLDFLLQRLLSSCILCFSFELLSISVLVFSYGPQIQGWRRGCLCKSSQVAYVPSNNFKFNAQWVSWLHTAAAYSAFLGAFIVGCWLHYTKIVQNEHYGYPDEWFPSVSATIGDRYPERSVFMVFIAITSGPRFILVGLWYLMTARPNSNLPKIIAGMGLFRTLTCGGWTYVTSTDDHNWHDIFMVSYLVATIPWTLGCLALSPPNPQAIKYRKYFACAFFGTLVPMTYYFLQHKIHKVAGGKQTI